MNKNLWKTETGCWDAESIARSARTALLCAALSCLSFFFSFQIEFQGCVGYTVPVFQVPGHIELGAMLLRLIPPALFSLYLVQYYNRENAARIAPTIVVLLAVFAVFRAAVHWWQLLADFRGSIRVDTAQSKAQLLFCILLALQAVASAVLAVLCMTLRQSRKIFTVTAITGLVFGCLHGIFLLLYASYYLPGGQFLPLLTRIVEIGGGFALFDALLRLCRSNLQASPLPDTKEATP